jgi:hypothetical protein
MPLPVGGSRAASDHRRDETCAAPVTAGRATTGSAIGPTPAFQRSQAHQRGGLGRHGAAHVKGASNEPARGAAMSRRATKSFSQRSWPPVGGTFHFENLIMPPLTKTCPKMVPAHTRGSLCVKDAFAKKFFGAGRDSAGGALASVLRKHSTEGRTPDAVERCVRRCAGSHPPRGTGTCRPDSERFEPFVDISRLFAEKCPQ